MLFNILFQMLADRTEKVCEMAAIMKESVRVDEEACNQQQELMARLMTENKVVILPWRINSSGYK